MNNIILNNIVILSDSEYGYNCFIDCICNHKKYHFQTFFENFDLEYPLLDIIKQEILNYERFKK